MAFPGYPLATNKTGATAQASDHPAHHNAIATAVNALQVQVVTKYTSSQFTDGTIATVDIADEGITYPKLAADTKSPARSSATGSAISGITAETTICTLNLPSQTRAGDWFITGHVRCVVNSPAAGNLFAVHIKDGATVLVDSPWGAISGARRTLSGTAFLPVAASTAKTITMILLRWAGSTSTVDVPSLVSTNRLQAKFWPT